MLADRIVAWSLAFALAFFPSLASAQSTVLNGFPPGTFQSRAAIDAATAGGCSQATTFLARTSGLSGTETSAYTAMICGMMTDGTWASLDLLYLFATNTTTTANLNLVSTSFTLTPVNSPTFTPDVGYTGNGTSMSLSTGWIPASSAINYALNNAAVGVFVQSSRTSGTSVIASELGADSSATNNIQLFPFYNGTNQFRGAINDAGNFPTPSGPTSSKGAWVLSRVASTGYSVYFNGSSTAVTTAIQVSTGLASNQLKLLAATAFGGATQWTSDQISAVWTGAGVTGAQAVLINNRINTFLASLSTPVNVY